MNVIHVMKDGTIRESVEGIVIRDERFYELLKNIQAKRVKGVQNEKICS